METYDPAAITIIVANQIIEGFMDGTFANVTWDEDSFTPFTGAGGETARVRNRNRSGKIVITLMQGSPGNAILSALHNQDLLLGVPPGAAMIKDNLGTTLLGGPNCYVQKLPDTAYAKDYQGREWTIVVPKLEGVVGGNLLAG